MPKILLYISSKFTWIFLFYGTDINENRAHVHVGKRDTEKYCKIWLEPEISIADRGDLSEQQLKQIVSIVQNHKDTLMNQWHKFIKGDKIKIITIKE